MPLRLVTWNIHKCIGGLDRRYRPERVIAVLRHYSPDIVTLQEVDDGVARSRGHRQVDLLAEATGLRHRCFFPNVEVRGGGVYGNAILSRHPILATENVDVTQGRRKRRAVLHARLRVRAAGGRRTRTLHVFDLHLGLAESERRAQLAQFLAAHPFRTLHERTPLVVAGDFNDLYGSLGPRLLAPEGLRATGEPVATFPAWLPLRPLDAVWARGDLRVTAHQRGRVALTRQASDHLPLVVDFALM